MNNVVYVVQLLNLNQIGAKGSPGPDLLENSIVTLLETTSHNGTFTYFACRCKSQQRHHHQNVELLSDSAAPRYGYESDEEDQLNPLFTRPLQRPTRVSIQGYPSSDHSLKNVIIASGDVGKAWAQGAQLGERRVEIIVDELAVPRLLLMTTYH